MHPAFPPTNTVQHRVEVTAPHVRPKGGAVLRRMVWIVVHIGGVGRFDPRGGQIDHALRPSEFRLGLLVLVVDALVFRHLLDHVARRKCEHERRQIGRLGTKLEILASLLLKTT